MASPLKQVNVGHQQPLIPKVVSLYEKLFATDGPAAQAHAPGYWVEFFLLPVSESQLKSRLDETPRDTIVRSPGAVIPTLLAAAIANVASADHHIAINSLAILRVALRSLLRHHRLTSAELIACLGGPDRADQLLDSLTDHLLRLVRVDANKEAVRFVVVVAAASAGTCLAPVLTQKNLFAALISVVDRWDPYPPPDSDPEISDVEDFDIVTVDVATQAFIAIGVLANLAKFDDGADVYQQRISEFIDEHVIAKLVHLGIHFLNLGIEEYEILITPKRRSWFWFGSSPPPASVQLRGAWPIILLPIYEFAAHNDLFGAMLAGEYRVMAPLLELGSHLLSNSHKDARAYAYGRLHLLILRVLIETQLPTLAETFGVITISQQRTPALPRDTTSRPILAGVLDVVQCGLRFNLGRGMDPELYKDILVIIYQCLACMVLARQAVGYNWPQLWQTLLSVIKYLKKASGDSPPSPEVMNLLLKIITGAVLRRDLWDPDDWEALYFKVVQSPQLFEGLEAPALQAMIAQFELLMSQNPERDYTNDVFRQGLHAFGQNRPLSELMPRYSELSEQRFLRRAARVGYGDASAL